MPPTLNKIHECQIIRKIFSNHENANKAMDAFKEWKIPAQDIGMAIRFDDEQINDCDYQERHDTAQRWLTDWAHFRTSQSRPTVMPLRLSYRSASVSKFTQ